MSALFKGITTEKIDKETALLWLRRLIYIICFVGLTVHLFEYDNVSFQDNKDIQNGIALLFFTVLILTMERTKLLRWWALVIAAAAVPYIYFSTHYLEESVNLYRIQLYHAIVLALVLLVVADVAISAKTVKFSRMNLLLLFTFLLMFYFVYQSISSYSAYPLFLLYFFIRIDRKEWENITDSLTVAQLIVFILLMIASFTQPKKVYQQSWYGIFLNIGNFAMFQGISLAFSVYAMIRSKNKFGRLSIPYFISALWFLADIWVGLLKCGTRTYLSGLIFFALVMFVFYPKSRKDDGKKGRRIRGGIVIGLILAGILLGFVWMKVVYSPNFPEEEIKQRIMDSPLGKIGKIEHNITRLIGPAIDGGRTGDGMVDPIDGVFEPYTVASYINYFSSGRLRIWTVFLRDTGFQGNLSGGKMVGKYFAFNAHNEYVQHMYRYGIPAGILNIVLMVGAIACAIAGFVKTRKDIFLLPMLYLAMMLGCWVGESASICYPLTFIGFFLLYPILHQREMNEVSEVQSEETE